MNAMKKVWIYKRAGIKNWWVGWYEGSMRKAKALRHAVEQLPVGEWL